MQSFLEKCTEKIFKAHEQNLGKICMVLPSRRAGLFIRKFFASLATSPVFLPEIFSIEDFTTQLSGFKIPDKTDLLFEFYEVHKTIEQDKAQTLEKFTDWGSSLLQDFNEIDEYLVDAKELFAFLSDTKAIELWSPETGQLTDFEKRFLAFYKSLFNYYQGIQNRLLQKQEALQGYASRFVAENIANVSKGLPWEKTYFLGFNALTKAEERIIGFLIKAKKAEILWDADNYYLDYVNNGTKNEAGNFLRQHFAKPIFNKPDWIFDDFKERKKIEIIGAPLNIGQSKICGKILKELSDEAKQADEDIALVLADESLLLPVLNSIPENINDLNITMGYPLNLAPIYQLLDKLFTLHKNAIEFKRIRKSTQSKFYLKDVMSCLGHPMVKANANYFFQSDQNKFISKLNNLLLSNKIFISKAEIEGFLETKNNDLIKIIFSDWENGPATALECLSAITDLFKNSLLKKARQRQGDKVELEYLFHFAKIINRVRELGQTYQSIESLESLQSIFKQIVKSSKVPFLGKPLKGLQIMGMLETRTLDFEKVIVLSLNEGILPASKTQSSFIPFDIKKQFGLPTYKERNSIFAYHFYRLLQRANHSWLLYNTEPGQLGGGDKSRFLSQLQNELPSYNSHISISDKIYAASISNISSKNKISIQKDARTTEKIAQIAEKGFSATVLNTFRNCPLKFYFSNILKLEEDNKIEETVDAATLGTIVHECLQEIYAPFINQILSSDLLKKASLSVKNILIKSFGKNFPGVNVNFGKNYLILQAAEVLTKNVIKSDLENLDQNKELIITSLEEKFNLQLTFHLNGKEQAIGFKGFIDRIDQLEQLTRIIDYKTGRVDNWEISLKSFEDLSEKENTDKAFQLLMYALLYRQSGKENKLGLQAGIIPVRKKKQAFLALSFNKKDQVDDEAIAAFQAVLKDTLTDLYDTGKPFDQTSNLKNCTYCTFKTICNR
jgi:ATP-dependent helicase/nuclease subunit B